MVKNIHLIYYDFLFSNELINIKILKIVFLYSKEENKKLNLHINNENVINYY